MRKALAPFVAFVAFVAFALALIAYLMAVRPYLVGVPVSRESLPLALMFFAPAAVCLAGMFYCEWAIVRDSRQVSEHI